MFGCANCVPMYLIEGDFNTTRVSYVLFVTLRWV